uniref:Uncharacterized protein n=1 Tax=Arundo donax TaxID=35708 RepID=A0A0A8ZJ82_ARUDO
MLRLWRLRRLSALFARYQFLVSKLENKIARN